MIIKVIFNELGFTLESGYSYDDVRYRFASSLEKYGLKSMQSVEDPREEGHPPYRELGAHARGERHRNGTTIDIPIGPGGYETDNPQRENQDEINDNTQEVPPQGQLTHAPQSHGDEGRDSHGRGPTSDRLNDRIDVANIQHPWITGFGKVQIVIERPLGRC